LAKDEGIAMDYDTLGLTLAGHPMERFRPRLHAMGAIDSQDLGECQGGEQVIIGGLVTVRQRPESAKGTVFLLLEDEWGTANIVVSRALDDQYYEVVRHAAFLLVEGRIERDGGQINVIGQRFHPLGTGPRRALTHHSHDFR
jgi:error-prone DNA polymerase